MANRDFFRRLGAADEIAVSTLAKLKQPKTLRRVLLTRGPRGRAGGRACSPTWRAAATCRPTTPTSMPASSRSPPTCRASWPTSRCSESQTVEKGQVLFTLDQEPFRIALAGAEANLGTVRNQLDHPAGDLSPEAGADRAGQDRRRLLRDQLPAPAGSAEARRVAPRRPSTRPGATSTRRASA